MNSPYRHFDNMCWPVPGDMLSDCAYALAHVEAANEIKREMLVAVSVITAYQELIALPRRKRDKIIMELRNRESE